MEENNSNQQGENSTTNSEITQENLETTKASDNNLETTETTQASDDKKDTTNTTPTTQLNRNLIIGVLVALLVLAGGYFYIQNSSRITAPASAPTPSTTIDAKQVVARVNGSELLGDQLNLQMKQTAQLSGIPSLDGLDEQTLASVQAKSLDAIVNTELILQTARKAGLNIEDATVVTEFDKIVEKIGGTDAANQRLTDLGFTEESFKENLANDLLIKKYLDSVTEESELAVSDEEIQTFYDQVSAQQDNVPALAEVRTQIEQQLSLQKQQAALSTIVDKLRTDADIELLI